MALDTTGHFITHGDVPCMLTAIMQIIFGLQLYGCISNASHTGGGGGGGGILHFNNNLNSRTWGEGVISLLYYVCATS